MPISRQHIHKLLDFHSNTPQRHTINLTVLRQKKPCFACDEVNSVSNNVHIPWTDFKISAMEQLYLSIYLQNIAWTSWWTGLSCCSKKGAFRRIKIKSSTKDWNEVLEIIPIIINNNNLSKPTDLKIIKGQMELPHTECDYDNTPNTSWLFFSLLLIFASTGSRNSDWWDG